MEKELIAKIEKDLEQKKETIEKELSEFAKKDEHLKDDWDTKYPSFGKGVGGGQLEDEAKEVEEYSNLLPVEFSLENRLRDINLALGKIKNGEYGICEKCKKSISKERIEAIPEARLCSKCRT